MSPRKKTHADLPHVTITMTGYQCRRCFHAWLPRSGRVPKRCPNCKSWSWQTPPSHPERRPRVAGDRPTPDRPKPPRKRPS